MVWGQYNTAALIKATLKQHTTSSLQYHKETCAKIRNKCIHKYRQKIVQVKRVILFHTIKDLYTCAGFKKRGRVPAQSPVDISL